MPSAGFEHTIPEAEQPQPHTLDGAATVCWVPYNINNINISSVMMHIHILYHDLIMTLLQGRN